MTRYQFLISSLFIVPFAVACGGVVAETLPGPPDGAAKDAAQRSPLDASTKGPDSDASSADASSQCGLPDPVKKFVTPGPCLELKDFTAPPTDGVYDLVEAGFQKDPVGPSIGMTISIHQGVWKRTTQLGENGAVSVDVGGLESTVPPPDWVFWGIKGSYECMWPDEMVRFHVTPDGFEMSIEAVDGRIYEHFTKRP